MNFSWKRVLSLALAIFMVVGMIPFNALHIHAAEDDNISTSAVEDTQKFKKGEEPKQVAGDGLTWEQVGDYFTDCGNLVEHTHSENCYTKSCDHKDGHLSTCYPSNKEYEVCPDKDTHAHSGTANLSDVVTIDGTDVKWITSHPAYPAVYAIYKAAYDEAYASAKFMKDMAGMLAGVAAVATVTVCYTTTQGEEPTCGHDCGELGSDHYTKLCILTEHTHTDPDCYAVYYVQYTDINNNEVNDATDTYYTVKYVSEGTELLNKSVLVGLATPTVENPTREHYTFAGWDPAVAATVTADATYTAKWTPVEYTVTWMYGEYSTTTNVAYGTMPTAPSVSIPADKDSDGNVMATYVIEWPTLAPVAGPNDSYTATVTKVTAEYTVTFVNYDGTELQSGKVEYGVLPEYKGENPVKPSDEDGEWIFNGWNPEVSTVTKEVTYTAVFTESKYVAEVVGGEKYTTVQEAVDAAGNGDTVKLLNDVYVTKEVNLKSDDVIILDLNGHILGTAAPEDNGDGTKGDNTQVNVIHNYGHLTVTDSVGTGAILAQDTFVDAKGNQSNSGSGIRCMNAKSELVIDGARLHVNNIGHAVLVFSGKLTVNEGSKITTSVEGGWTALYLQGGAEAVINGGSFEISYPIRYEESIIKVLGGSKLTINGGSFDLADQTNGISKDADATVVIYGGTFGFDPSAYVHSDYIADYSEENNETWTVRARNIYTITFVYGDGVTADKVFEVMEGGSFETPADPTWEGHIFAGWGEVKNTPDADATYNAAWQTDSDNDGYEDGSENDPWWTVSVEQPDGTFATTTNVLNGETYDVTPDPIDKANAIFVKWVKTVDTENHTVTYTVEWNTNDTNDNNVDDASETYTVTIVGNGTVNDNAESYTAIYDSKTETNVTLVIVPSIVDGTSKSYVSSVDVFGAEQALSYDNCVVTLNVAPAVGEIVVTFTDCGFVYDEDGEMRFYVGMEDPDYETLYNAVIDSPEYSAEFVKSVKYLARPADTYTITIPVLAEIDFNELLPGSGYILGMFGIPSKLVIGGNSESVELDDAWLDVGESFKTLTSDQLQQQYNEEIEKIKAKIAAIDLTDISISNIRDKFAQLTAITEEVNTLINTIKNETQYLGYHQFGASGLVDENGNAQEILQVIYDNGAMHLEDDNVVVTLVDDRTETTITGGDLTFEYDEFTDEDIMNALVLTDVDGNVIDGELNKYINLVGSNVGTYTYNVYYEGSWDYKPCTVEFTLTVVKAPSTTDVPNVNVTYGESYDGTPVITNKHGKVISVDTIEFILGLDVSELDIDGDGVKGLAGQMQLLLPSELQTILNVVGLKDGATMNLNELVGMLTNDLVAPMLEQWGITSDVVASIESVLDAVSNVVETNELLITIGGSYPTNVGAYLHGAVTVDSNYETSYDVGYIIIKPAASQVYLDWNYTDSNGIFSWELLKQFDLGASAYDDAAFTTKNADATALVQNLFFGIDENGELVLELHPEGTDVETLEAALGNGAFTQLAFIADFGNELVYAKPIARAFVIVPNIANVELVDAEGNALDAFTFTFDNTAKKLFVTVDGKLVECDITYTGVLTNTNVYEPTTEAPVHAGAYGAMVVYVARNENGDVIAVGADAAALVIMPTESTIEVDNKIVTAQPGVSYDLEETLVTVGSTVPGLKPDTTIISAQIASDGTFSEISWSAVNGNVNIDFPAWVDELLAEHVPGVADGMTAGELKNMLQNKLPSITAKLVELGATEEIVNSLSNLVANVSTALAEIPDNLTLTFNDNVSAENVGVYAVVGIVTDSDHYPSVDAGVLVITPDVDLVHLKWNHEDENGIWTRELLKQFDLLATAFDDPNYTVENAAATAKITYQFIGINKNGELVVYNNADELVNGAYIELAYIELEVDGKMIVSDLIARELIVVPALAEVIFVDETGAENNDRVFTFDNTEKTMDVQVSVNGEVIVPAEGTLTFTYTGVQTNGKEYHSNTAPVHAGVYTVLAVYYAAAENGSTACVGTAVGVMAIEPAASSIEVTGGTVTYDGKEHTATVEVTGASNADYTLISGGAYVSGDIDEIGVDALHGNVNIDFPAWLDKALAEHEFKTEGVDTAYLIDFISSYRDDLVAAIPVDELVALGVVTEDEINGYIEKLNAYIDEVLAVLPKLPKDVALTFNDDVAYTEPGYYFYYGIVTDSDHYPSTDTGLLVIEKKDMTFDLLDTTVVWDAQGHMVNVNNPMNADYVTVVIDRENNTINIMVDEDAQYLLNSLARILDVEFDGDVQMSTIINNYNGEELAAAIVELIGELEALNLPEEIAKALAAVKAELETLPTSGTVIVNGELPSEVGEYEVYAISYSEYYKINTAEATLTIVPKPVTITVDSHEVHQDADMPELTYTVEVEVEGYPLDVTVVCEAEDTSVAGEFNITAKYTEDEHYDVTVVDGTLTVEAHVEGEVVVENNVDPTCTETGSYDNVVYCTVCGKELSRETITVPALGHTEGEVVVENEVAADCDTDGSYDNVVYCSVCGEELSRETITVPALGHTEGEPVKENEVLATDTTPGSYDLVVYCSVCGEELSREHCVDLADFVCWNMQTGVYYTDLSDALEAADDDAVETIQMLKDYSEKYVIVAPGTTLDLNGKTVTAKFVVGFNGSHVIDTVYTGKLAVDPANIELAQKNQMLPVWNCVDGYSFTDVTINDNGKTTGMTWDAENDIAVLKFVTFYRHPALLSGNISDHDVKVIVRASWTKADGTAVVDQELVFSDDHVRDVIAANGRLAFELTFNGYSNVKNLKLTAMVITESGVEFTGTLYEQNN